LVGRLVRLLRRESREEMESTSVTEVWANTVDMLVYEDAGFLVRS
jgi:hypothetical protein